MTKKQFEKELCQILKQYNLNCYKSNGLYIELKDDYMVEILCGKHMNLWQDWNFKDGNCHIIDRYENLEGFEPKEALEKILEWSNR